MNLSKLERLQLANQFKILAALYPDEADYYRRYQKIAEEGYALHYSDFAEHIFDETPPQLSSEVIDILNMHSDLLLSFQQLAAPDGLTEDDVRFRGFDGNKEIHHLSYADFFLKNLGRFDELHRDNYNSHMPTLHRYRAMLEVWRAARQGLGAKPLSAAQIKGILDAGNAAFI